MNQKSDKNNSNELISTDKDCKEHDKDHNQMIHLTALVSIHKLRQM